MKNFKSVNDKAERRQQMRNADIMESKYKGRKMHSLRNTKQTAAATR